ncbi:MAG: hypothetical protein HS126_22025 [Anaerolineales bacterium]|nr:hypothetical protein [Anaerolineales bacterium]
MYKADLVATGYMAPVRPKYITDVTKLGRGNLSNEILRSVEFNYPGLGEHLRDLGYEGRDIYNTLFEMHQLNTKPGWNEHGSPVVDLLGDLTGNKDIRAGIETLYQQRLAEILPASMQGVDEKDYDPEQQKPIKSSRATPAPRRSAAITPMPSAPSRSSSRWAKGKRPIWSTPAWSNARLHRRGNQRAHEQAAQRGRFPASGGVDGGPVRQ